MQFSILVLFFHILGAVCLFIGLGMEGVIIQSLSRVTTTGQVFSYAGHMKLLRITFAAAAILLLLSGLYMTIDSWGWTAWVICGLTLLIILAGAGNITGAKIGGVFKSLAKADDSLPAEAKEKLSAPFFLKSFKIKIVMAMGIVFMMTMKTGWLVSIITVVVTFLIGFLLGNSSKK